MRKVLVLAVVALGALGLGVSNALAKDLVVDKDKVQCPKAGFTSIQAAVTAASPGDKIKVCPDTYSESVNVPKTLEIVASPGTKLNTEDACLADPPAAPDPTKEAIVHGGAFSFNLPANNIKLDGFVIQGANFGVQTSSSFSGYTITGNLAQDSGNLVTTDSRRDQPPQQRSQAITRFDELREVERRGHRVRTSDRSSRTRVSITTRQPETAWGSMRRASARATRSGSTTTRRPITTSAT